MALMNLPPGIAEAPRRVPRVISRSATCAWRTSIMNSSTGLVGTRVVSGADRADAFSAADAQAPIPTLTLVGAAEPLCFHPDSRIGFVSCAPGDRQRVGG